MNHTDLDTSKRLAKVWPHKDTQIDQHKIERGRWVWQHWDDVGKSGWDLALAGWGILLGASAIDWIPARDLSELEAEIGRMGFIVEVLFVETSAYCLLRKAVGLPSFTEHGAKHIINALGNALAEAKEKLAGGKGGDDGGS